MWFDTEQERTTTYVLDIDAQPLWDVAEYDVDEWDSEIVVSDDVRSPAAKIHTYQAFGIAHKPAGQPVTLNGYDKYFQVKGYGIR